MKRIEKALVGSVTARVIVKRLSEKLEKLMTAATFAEAGEHETAREIIREDEKTDRMRPTKRADKTMRASSPPRQ